MISVSDEAIRSQPDFRFSFDCRLADVLVAGSASSSRQCASCFRDARSSFGLEMVPSQSAEMIRRECNGDLSTVDPLVGVKTRRRSLSPRRISAGTL